MIFIVYFLFIYFICMGVASSIDMYNNDGGKWSTINLWSKQALWRATPFNLLHVRVCVCVCVCVCVSVYDTLRCTLAQALGTARLRFDACQVPLGVSAFSLSSWSSVSLTEGDVLSALGASGAFPVQILKSQSSIVALYGKHTMALTFENLYQLALLRRWCCPTGWTTPTWRPASRPGRVATPPPDTNSGKSVP